MIALAGLVLAQLMSATAPMDPAEAIALAEAHPDRRNTGVFEMTVAAADRRTNALYLNSDVDYRSPRDLTFDITPIAARALEKRLGERPEIALVGKKVTVRGDLRLVPIANMFAGQPRSLNRYQHTVFVRDASQIFVD